MTASRQNTRSKFPCACTALAFTLAGLFTGQCYAEDSIPSRTVKLPATAFDYTSQHWPRHVKDIAAHHDNTPANNPITNHGATLGRVLFYDTSLSVNNTTSCASCHKQKLAFTDDRPLSIGFDQQLVKRNSMSLVNSRFYKRGRFFWDERATTLEQQVLMPIENPIEMGHSIDKLMKQLASDPLYPALFKKAFGDTTVTDKRIANALSQFVRSIVSFRSKYDQGRSQVDSVTDEFPNFTKHENLGKRQFFGRGRCAECHLPNNRPDQNKGLRQSAFFFISQPTVNGVDSVTDRTDGGVGDVSKKTVDVGRFKVPSLRNIEVTGPYMHDGRFKFLSQVLEYYNWSVGPHPNLDPRLKDFAANGMALPQVEKEALEAFLLTLTDRRLLKDPRFSDPFVRPEK